MTKEEILSAIAPCALCCHTCLGVMRNERINKVGFEQYAKEVMSYSHYVPFKKDGID